jgi:hypothetical protein
MPSRPLPPKVGHSLVLEQSLRCRPVLVLCLFQLRVLLSRNVVDQNWTGNMNVKLLSSYYLHSRTSFTNLKPIDIIVKKVCSTVCRLRQFLQYQLPPVEKAFQLSLTPYPKLDNSTFEIHISPPPLVTLSMSAVHGHPSRPSSISPNGKVLRQPCIVNG